MSDTSRPSYPNLLIISHDIVGQRMAGPGIRYRRLAQVMSQHIATKLAVPNESPSQSQFYGQGEGYAVARYTHHAWPSLEPHVREATICLFPSDTAEEFPAISQSRTYLVVDGYDPLLAEWFALNKARDSKELEVLWRRRMVTLTQQYLIGDFFICASERQRDWWLGLLEANGRINPATYGFDASLRKLLDVVPFGLANSLPQHTHQMVKGVWPGITPEDRLLLWGGGLWPWLDPFTAIRAVGGLWARDQRVKLIFPGTMHPNPAMAATPTHTVKAKQLARELNLLDKAVFFGDWIPYEDWDNVLLECDIALSLHYETLETRLAFRSRILDYIRAGLPTIATKGDATSDLLTRYELGILVDYEDVSGVVQAISDLLQQPRDRHAQRFAAARQELAWERAAQPLIDFCRNPYKAADKQLLRDQSDSPLYDAEKRHLVEQNRVLREQINGYERGRIMRLMRWLHRTKSSLLSRVS